MKRSQKHKKQQKINPSLTYLIVVITFVVLLISVTFFVLLGGKTNSETITPTVTTTPSTIATPVPAEIVDVVLKADSIQISESKFEVGTEYSFAVTKSPSSTCEAIRNTDLGYTIAVYGNTATIPFKPVQAGEYLFECIGQNVSFKVTAR